MTREEAIEKIAQGEYEWGLQRDMYVRDVRDRELPKGEALIVFRGWAKHLPEGVFLSYAKRHAPEYLTGETDSE